MQQIRPKPCATLPRATVAPDCQFSSRSPTHAADPDPVMDNRSEIQGVQDDAVQAATRKSALTLGHDHLFGHKLSPFARQAINNTARPLGASSSKGKHSARARSAAVLAPGLAAGDWYPPQPRFLVCRITVIGRCSESCRLPRPTRYVPSSLASSQTNTSEIRLRNQPESRSKVLAKVDDALHATTRMPIQVPAQKGAGHQPKSQSHSENMTSFTILALADRHL